MKRILIVDDDPAILDTLVELLGESYAVEGSMDGAQALAKLEAAPYDLVVLDLMMPVLDGASMKREMDARQILVPVIVVSAARDLAACARDLAAADWVPKPFKFSALEAKIARVLAGSGPAPAGAPPGPAGAPAGPGPSSGSTRRGSGAAGRRPAGRTIRRRPASDRVLLSPLGPL